MIQCLFLMLLPLMTSGLLAPKCPNPWPNEDPGTTMYVVSATGAHHLLLKNSVTVKWTAARRQCEDTYGARLATLEDPKVYRAARMLAISRFQKR